ncbi:hypothetical protein ACVWYH_004891 [Bradyrhizobium sp. GM24.11]
MVPTTALLLLEHRPAASRRETVGFLFYSVFGGEHQREHAGGPLGIAWITLRSLRLSVTRVKPIAVAVVAARS